MSGGLDVSEYTYAGVLAWLEHEWRRFHREREVWQNERAILCSAVETLRRELRLLQVECAHRKTPGEPPPDVRKEPQELISSQGPLAALRVGTSSVPPQTQPPVAVDSVSSAASAVQTPPAAEAQPGLPPQAQLPAAAEPPQVDSTPTTPKREARRNRIAAAAAAAAAASDAEASVGSALTSDSETEADTVIRAFSGSGPAGMSTMRHASRSSTLTREPSDGAGWPPRPLARGSARGAAELLHCAPPGSPTPEETGPPTPPARQALEVPQRRRWEHRVSMRGHFGAVRCACWAGDSTQLLTGGDDGMVRMWDARRVSRAKERDEPVQTLRGHTCAVLCVDAVRDEVIAGGADGSIRMWRLPSEAAESIGTASSLGVQVAGHTDAVWGVSVLRGCDDVSLPFASCGADGALLLWRRLPAAHLHTIEQRVRPPADTAASVAYVSVLYTWTPGRDRRMLLVAYDSGSSHGVAAYCLPESPDGEAVQLWQRALSARPTCLASEPGFAQWAHRRCSLDREPDVLAAVGDAGGGVDILDVADGRSVFAFGPHTSAVTSVDHCGECVLTASHDGTAKRHDATPQSHSTELSTPHTRRLGESITGLTCHAAKGITVTLGADCTLAFHTAPRQ